jgi:hypothetical protein
LLELVAQSPEVEARKLYAVTGVEGMPLFAAQSISMAPAVQAAWAAVSAHCLCIQATDMSYAEPMSTELMTTMAPSHTVMV